MASEELMQISRDEAERMRLLSEEKYILDNQSKVVSAERKGRKEGIEIGREEGIEIGVERGIEKGREEGIEKGREEVLKLIDQGLSIDEIKQRLGNKAN